MRERFDFPSVSKILLENSKADGISFTEYYNTIFDYADFKLGDDFDSENAGKIINGERKIPHKVLKLYDTDEEKDALRKDILRVLNRIHDLPYVAKQLNILLWQDDGISTAQKERMQRDSDKEFITNCLIFAIDRKFVSNEEKSRTQFCTKLILSDYLLDTRLPSPSKVFIGRSQELSLIHEHLQDEPVLFLSGIGGIGKSELAKQYGKQYKKAYSNIIFLHYDESLRQTICNLDFVGDTPNINPNAQFEMHYRLFKILPSDALVVLDNFDALPEEDELFHNFLSLPFHLLITTRNHIADEPCYTVNEIASDTDLLELFYTHAPRSKVQPDVVARIIDEVFRHTLTVEMAAKTITASGITPEHLLSELQKDRLGLSNPNKIKVKKDEKTTRDTLRGHIQTLFRVQNLLDEQVYYLRHILLMPKAGISKTHFKRWMQTDDVNCVNELIEYGWINEDAENQRIFMHPFINEVIQTLGTLQFGKCHTFIQSFEQEYINATAHYNEILSVTRNIAEMTEINDLQCAFSFLRNALSYLSKYTYIKTMGCVLDAMQSAFDISNVSNDVMAIYEFYRAQESSWTANRNITEQHLENAVKYIEPITEQNAELAFEIYQTLSLYYFNVPEKGRKYADAALEIHTEYGIGESLDILFEQWQLRFMHTIQTAPNTSIEDMLQSEELLALTQRAKDLGVDTISNEELLQNTKKIELDEVTPMPDEIQEVFNESVQVLENMADNPVQKEISFDKVLGTVMSTALEQIMKNGLQNSDSIKAWLSNAEEND